LEHYGHKEKSKGSAQDPGYKKEKCAGPITDRPEPAIEIFIYGGNVQSIVYGQQYIGDNEIPGEVSEYHLHITELGTRYPARYRNKGDTGKGCPDHTKGYQIPRGLLPCLKKIGVGIVFSGKIGNGQKY